MGGEGDIIALMFCYMVKVSWLLYCFRLTCTGTAQTTITSTTVAVGLVQEDA